jgi:hypothetical protein
VERAPREYGDGGGVHKSTHNTGCFDYFDLLLLERVAMCLIAIILLHHSLKDGKETLKRLKWNYTLFFVLVYSTYLVASYGNVGYQYQSVVEIKHKFELESSNLGSFIGPSITDRGGAASSITPMYLLFA